MQLIGVLYVLCTILGLHMSASNFPLDVIAAAQKSHDHYFPKGPYVSVSLAQWAIESARGHDEPPNSNNPFGIKATAGQPYVISMTREVIKGVSQHIPQHFAKYTSLADAFDAHARLLATSPIYAEAQRATNPQDYVRAMAKHYATAPNYAEIILAIMKSQNLYQFDAPKLPSQVTPERVISPSAAAPAYANDNTQKVSIMSTPGNTDANTPAPPSLLETLENLVTAALDAAPEVSRDYKMAVAEFQKLKASPIGVQLEKVIGQLFSHATATDAKAASVTIVTPKIS